MFLVIAYILMSSATGVACYWDRVDSSCEWACIAVPIADATTFSMREYKGFIESPLSVEELYNSMPFSWESSREACLRVHQFLFNEVVKVISLTDDEVCFEAPHVFYDSSDGSHSSIYWTQRKNVVLLSQFKHDPALVRMLPTPYEYRPDGFAAEGIVVLTKPVRDERRNIVFSAGTRFIKVQAPDASSPQYIVGLLHPYTQRPYHMLVPRESAYGFYYKSSQQAIRVFVELLKSWASLAPQKMAAVWGGCSFSRTYDPLEYFIEQEGIDARWMRPDKELPHTGCDASGLILRGAQIAGLPYYFKNTTTLNNHLRPLHTQESIEEGDLFWYEGAVLVVSDLVANEAISAFSYSTWGGLVRSVKLSDFFDGIDNWHELNRAYLNHEILTIKNSDGELIKQIREYRILKMKSLFEHE